jgi:MFS family permease
MATPTHPVRGLASLRPLRHRGYALLWTAGLVSTIGTWMETVAVGALVVSRTGQATWAVLVAAGAFLPIGLLAPAGGALADRLPRRPVLIAGNLAGAVTAAALATLVATGHASPAAVLGLVTVEGSAAALIGPFRQAILPDLVPRAEFLPPSRSARPSSTWAVSSARPWPAPRWPRSATLSRSPRTRCRSWPW